MNSPSRNQPCPCGSGKKYKHCCGSGARVALQVPQFHHLVQQALGLHQQGQLNAAGQLYDQALAQRPDDPGLLGLKGLLCMQQGEPETALRFVERGLDRAPNDASLHNYRGQIFSVLGQDALAEAEFVRAVQLDAQYLEAWFNAGKLFLRRHKGGEAIHALGHAKRLAPGDREIGQLLAEAYFLDGRPQEAELALRQVCAEQTLAGMLWLAAALRAQGRDDEAMLWEQKAEASGMRDELYAVSLSVGRAQLHVGNLKAAEASLERGIALQPNNPAAYAELAQARRFVADDAPRVEVMTTLLPKCDDETRRALEFGLGKVYSDIGDYDRSFEHYHAANALVRSQQAYDIAGHAARIDHQIELFSLECLAGLPRGSDSNLPILIVGTPRSGTTLAESIVSSHSQVAGAGELTFWTAAMSHVMPGFPQSYTSEMARKLAEEYSVFLRQHSRTAHRITDKMPGNYMHLGIIHAVFPNAKFVHTKRHPIDACLSIYFQNFPTAHDYKWDLESLAAWYEQYQRLMAHWRSVLPSGVLYEIQYEDLVEDQEGESRKLLDFLGLEWEEGVLEFHKQERAVFTASKWQVRQPVYKTSMERWRRYEKHLGPLLTLLKYA